MKPQSKLAISSLVALFSSGFISIPKNPGSKWDPDFLFVAFIVMIISSAMTGIHSALQLVNAFSESDHPKRFVVVLCVLVAVYAALMLYALRAESNLPILLFPLIALGMILLMSIPLLLGIISSIVHSKISNR